MGDPNHNGQALEFQGEMHIIMDEHLMMPTVPSVRQMLSDNPYSIFRVHFCRVGGSVAESM